ncbi:MAG: hypothetical protein PF549_04680 [Patescibacteria group bacterium]|jgi:hypothetical protein|nr:hypothetical protein [Patescibacteria group bacterium]
MLKKITIILLILVIISAGVAYFYYQRNIFGQDKVHFELTASESINTGEEMEYTVRYKNNSDTRLEEFFLVFEYPENSLPVEGEEENENIKKRGDFRREINVGELNPGEEKIVIFNAIPFGKEGDSLEAKAWISYIPKNLTAKYEVNREHSSFIDSVPIEFDIQMPSTVDPSREESIRLLFSSDIEQPLTEIEIKVEYPKDFYLIRSTPKTDADENDFWRWPVLNKGNDGAIDIDGRFEGESGDVKIVRATLGIWINDNFIVLKEISKGTSISQSSLLFTILMNGKDNYIASPGEFVHYEIFFRNIGEETLKELFLLVDLDKTTIDPDKVEPLNGKFQEDRNIIIWSHVFDSSLQSLREDEEGKVEFWVEIKKDLPLEPEVKIKATMEKAIKEMVALVNTTVNLKQEVITEDYIFDITGPFPPEEGKKSVFNVKWEVESLFNDIENVKIKTGLSQFAKINKEQLPEEVELSFNEITKEIEITVDELQAKEKIEVVLQIEMEPSRDLTGDDILISQAVLSAKDKHTKQPIAETIKAIKISNFIETEEE